MSLSTFLGTQNYVFPTTLSPYVGAVILESFLYGLYIVLFAICAYVLLSRHKRLHWILLLSAIMMFALATSDMVYTQYILFGKLPKGTITFADLQPKYWLYISNNIVADSLLLYRCWVVWEYRKLVVVGPILLLLAATVCGYIFEASSSGYADKIWIYLIMTLVLNVTLTALTAARIWWLARKAKQILGTGLLRRYNATITILIESGFLYSLYIILDLGFRKQNTVSIILDSSLIQVVGIVPTLIIVEVGLGRAVHDIEANAAIAQLEGTKMNPTTTTRSFSEGIQCMRVHSRERRHESSMTFVNGGHPPGLGPLDLDINRLGVAGEMEHEIGIDSLRQLRGQSLRLSWEFGVGTSSTPELGVLKQVPKTI